MQIVVNGDKSLIYDGDGQLVGETTAGEKTTFLIDEETVLGHSQVAESRGATSVVYVYGLQRISMKDSILSYYLYDGHSGVRALLDSEQHVNDLWDYDGFGDIITTSNSGRNRFTYRGEYRDPTSGLLYLRARWLNNSIGRFSTRDTWEGASEEPAGLHAYIYSSNNPLDFDDPTGHASSLALGLSGACSNWCGLGETRPRSDSERSHNNQSVRWRDSAKIRRLAQTGYGRSRVGRGL